MSVHNAEVSECFESEFTPFITAITEVDKFPSSHSTSVMALSDAEFLVWIYEQIDGLLTRCIAQSNSRSNTPLSAARQTPPVYGGGGIVTHTKHSSHNGYNNGKPPAGASNVRPQSEEPDRHSGRKTPRRVQLFTSIENSGTFLKVNNNNYYYTIIIFIIIQSIISEKH